MRVPVIRLTFLGCISNFLRNTEVGRQKMRNSISKAFVHTMKGKI
jgi:hypothetical protein